MKNKIIGFILLLLVCFGTANNVNAASSYTINGKTVRYNDVSSSPNECWAYAQAMYKLIWGTGFTYEFNDKTNILKDYSDDQLTLTAAHLKEYVSKSALGATLRICDSEYLHGTDGWGHSQIIVQKDNNGFTVFQGGLSASPYCNERYYTWSEYCSTWKYKYIKYIKWPNASIQDTTKPTITNAKVANVTSDGYTVTCNVSDDVSVKTVSFATWTTANGQDDIIWREGTISGNTAQFTVKRSDHNNEYGTYITDIYAYDAAGNQSNYTRVSATLIEDNVTPNITNVRISDVDDTGYTVNCNIWDNVEVKKVVFVTWTPDKGGYDDKTETTVTQWQDLQNNVVNVSFRVNIKDHNNETGRYATHIYAYDEMGNCDNRLTNAAIGGDYWNPTKSLSLNGKTYDLYDTTYWNWNTAKTYCDSIGGYLVCINSAEEQAVVEQLLKSGTRESYWIGSTDQYDEGDWTWVTAETMGYKNWQSGQPDNYNNKEHYGIIWKSSGKWNDVPEDVRDSDGNGVYGFICERKSFITDMCYSVTDTGANISGKIRGKNTAGIKSAGFYFGTNEGGLSKYETVTGGLIESLDIYVNDYVGNLKPDTEYRYQFYYVDESGQEVKGSINSFSTKASLARLSSDILSKPDAVAEYNGRKYYRFDTNLQNWEAARRACEEIGGHLVTITDAEEQNVINNLISDGKIYSYWIGGTDRSKEGKWDWVTGEKFEYNNWYDGQPDDADGIEDYMMLYRDYSGQWNDTRCDGVKEKGFICEIDVPVITKQPEDISGKAGEEAALTIEADGEDLTYQWQESSDNGKTWTNCTSTGATASTFTFTLTSEMTGRKYRCIVTNSAGSVTSEEATVTVEMSKPVITKQPEDITVNAGETTAVTVEAEGEDLTYQWQKSNDSGKTWSDCTSAEAKLASFAFKATAYMDGRQFRCIVTNGAGSVTSEAAVLTVNKAPAITRQPKDITVNAGETTAVTVEAEGEGLTYQWQKSNDSGKTWSNCTSAEAKLASFAFKATAYMDGRQFRCIVTNSVGSVTSKAAVLTINKAPVITSQPENVTGSVGDAAGVSVKATGDNLSYRWQKSYDSGKTWSNCTSASAAMATFSFTLAENMNGRMYRCVVSNENGTTTSSAVKVTVTAEAPTITKQPVSTTAAVGEQVSMKVTAEGNGLKYQWQRSTDGGKTWANCTSTGCTSATFTFTMAKNFDGRRFRCRVSNSGGTVTSSAASVTLKVEAPVITKQPANAASEEGGQITLSITATGENLKYQWQRSTDGGKTWVNCTSEGSNTSKFGFEMLQKFDGRMFRCKVSNSGGTVTSREVTVRII